MKNKSIQTKGVDEATLIQISKNPENVYPFLDEITSENLVTIFERFRYTRTPERVIEFLKVFLEYGLAPLVNDDVQQSVFDACVIDTACRSNEKNLVFKQCDELADLYLKYNVKLSELTLSYFIRFLNISEYASKINFPEKAIDTELRRYGNFDKKLEIIDKTGKTNLKAFELGSLLNSTCCYCIHNPDLQYKKHTKNIINILLARNDIGFADWCEVFSYQLAREYVFGNFDLLKQNVCAELACCVCMGPKNLNAVDKNHSGITELYLQIVDKVNKQQIEQIEFANIPLVIIKALIRTGFSKWYPVIEKILKANPNMPKECVQDIIKQNSMAKRLVDKYWMGGAQNQSAVIVNNKINPKKDSCTLWQAFCSIFFGQKLY